MSIEEIMNKVRSFGCKNVTLTGGEPLLQEDINSLISTLYENHYWVNIETNGSVKYTGYQSSRIILTKDYKCGTSNMNSKMNLDLFDDIYSGDVIKFVVGSEEDMEQALSFYKAYKNEYPKRFPYWFFSPVFGQIEPKDIAAFLKEHR
jgi:7-carboxy-7-deazaguanine synthase